MSNYQAETKVTQQPPSYDEATNSDGNAASGLLSSEVITHLKLLFAFSKLRERVMNDVTIFNLDDSWLPTFEGEQSETVKKARHLIAEKRWDVYVRRAALRFEYWWLNLCGKINGKRTLISDLTERTPISLQSPNNAGKPIIHENNLPPLDVLMVWHSFLLSPRRYLEDCLLQGMMPLWHTNFPWAAIDQAIDPLLETGSYTPNPEAVAAFAASAPWVNEDDIRSPHVQCPECLGSELRTQCTTFNDVISSVKYSYLKSSAGISMALDRIESGLKTAYGWADAGFAINCPQCALPINRDVLCAQKFMTDIMRYTPRSAYSTADRLYLSDLLHRSSMPGTVLNSRSGLPQTSGSTLSSDFVKQVEFFPNILAPVLCHVDSAGRSNQTPLVTYTMPEIRRMIESTLSCREQMLFATGKTQRRANKHQRPMVRRMMAYYNDNPSLFTLDLASAVHRQGNFITKMQQIDWLHSPALTLTADRVITKYQRFMTVIAGFPKEMAVPTLDVDLAWHSHQLSPSSYLQYTYKMTGKFVDHDDKISEQKISESFARTSKNYQRLFNEPYSECTCWYCEAIHASVASFPGRFMLPGRTSGYRRPQNACDDQSTAHISTHNAVKLQNAPLEYKKKCQEHLRWLEKAYQRACDRAKKEGRPPPQRRHRAMSTDKGHLYTGYDGFGVAGGGTKGKALAVGAMGVGILAVGVGVIALDGDMVGFEGNTQVVDTHDTHGGGGCVGGACGGGVGWGGCSSDGGGGSGACGGSGGSCSGSSGGDGGGCGGGCGGCGG